jgi:hypothetical protein
VVNLEDGPDLHAQGNFVEREYTIERDGDKVAEVSKRWFRVRDTYGVEAFPPARRRWRAGARPAGLSGPGSRRSDATTGRTRSSR